MFISVPISALNLPPVIENIKIINIVLKACNPYPVKKIKFFWYGGTRIYFAGYENLFIEGSVYMYSTSTPISQ